MDYHVLSMKRLSSTPTFLLPYQVSSELLWVYRIKTSTPSMTRMSHIMMKKLKVCLKVEVSHNWTYISTYKLL